MEPADQRLARQPDAGQCARYHRSRWTQSTPKERLDHAAAELAKIGGCLVITTRSTHWKHLKNALACKVAEVRVDQWTVAEVNTLSRGSEWHRWEQHIHAPEMVLNGQYPANGWNDYLTALEAASPSLRAIGVTDYCVTRSYERVLEHKKNG